ncbi:hypothetical protein MADA3029_20038 [Vibrio nigripulchritudo MADA3029]|nr:hypothetical protein VIBNIMADA3020_1060012 [Vibrio nigripulchritudo MADA3020]CCN53712.1 hypothetical protein VIBNIMADA3021_380021 [Vibrio nigripulchritudo MADA3021]CCN58600.1 hypothetical protein MADA3029_20038 [Vibrio nigripulchritudo MADA3029]
MTQTRKIGKRNVKQTHVHSKIKKLFMLNHRTTVTTTIIITDIITVGAGC